MTDAPRILVADDDPGVRPLYIAICKRLGFDCDVAEDGDEALAKIRSKTYDVLLLDLMMPRLNGYQVIVALREMPQRPTVIVITAQLPKYTAGVEPDVVRAVIHKPFDINDFLAHLVEAAHEMFAKRKARGE